MSELNELTILIDGILSGNNEVRQNNEELLKGLRQKNINEYIVYFSNLLSGIWITKFFQGLSNVLY